jgi:hypothetical protein
MSPYLPRNGSSGSPYSEGGALYALGLTYANHGQDVRGFLLDSLRDTSSEVCCLSSVAALSKVRAYQCCDIGMMPISVVLSA